MSNPQIDEAVETVEMFYHVLKSIEAFDAMEVRGVVHGVLAPTLDEECVIAIYSRAYSDVQSLLELKHVKHFQALAMLSRSLFELTVELEMMPLVNGAALKMVAFKDVERLKACQQIADYEATNPPLFATGKQIHLTFITSQQARIERVAAALWPNVKINTITHWSGMRLQRRVKMLDSEMQGIYACFYRQLSWSVHGGLQGVTGLKPEAFAHMAGMSYHLSSLVYQRLIKRIVKIFQLSKHDPSLADKMQFARYLPLTKSPKEEADLRRDLGL